jgi:hypothetical protein
VPGIWTCGKVVETFTDLQTRFPVIARKFPVQLKKLPVPSLREFAKLWCNVSTLPVNFRPDQAVFSKIPCFFPVKQGNYPETGSLQTACTTTLRPAGFGWQATRNRKSGEGVSSGLQSAEADFRSAKAEALAQEDGLCV